MNATNYLKKIDTLYRYSPPSYDIAIGILRPCLLGIFINTWATIWMNPFLRKSPDAGMVRQVILGYSVLAMLIPSYHEISNIFYQSKLNKINQNQSKKDVVLICGAKSDSNGEANRLSAKGLEIIKKLAKTHSIVSKKVGTVEEINQEIDQIHREGRKIKLLWIKAHGNPSSISLGKEAIVGNDPVNSGTKRICVDKIHFNHLDPQSDIVLSSSYVGGPSKIVDGLNIAEWFQFHAGPNRRVFAPNTHLFIDGMNRIEGPDSKVHYEFKGAFGRVITSDISYTKVIEKINKEQPPLNNSLKTKILSNFRSYRSFDYKKLIPEGV